MQHVCSTWFGVSKRAQQIYKKIPEQMWRKRKKVGKSKINIQNCKQINKKKLIIDKIDIPLQSYCNQRISIVAWHAEISNISQRYCLGMQWILWRFLSVITPHTKLLFCIVRLLYSPLCGCCVSLMCQFELNANRTVCYYLSVAFFPPAIFIELTHIFITPHKRCLCVCVCAQKVSQNDSENEIFCFSFFRLSASTRQTMLRFNWILNNQVVIEAHAPV